VVQKQSGELTFDKDYSLPRGYGTSDTEGNLNLSNNLLFSVEYHFPIDYVDNGLGLSVLHVNVLKSFLFSDWGAGWNKTFNTNEWRRNARNVVGASLRAETSLFSMLPMEIGVEGGYKTREREGFANLVVLFGF
jgi:hypothetical protein